MMNSRPTSSQQQQRQLNSKYAASAPKYRNDTATPNQASIGNSLSTSKHYDKPNANIMYDPRVIRGSTINLRRQIETRLNNLNEQQQQQQQQRRIKSKYASSANRKKTASKSHDDEQKHEDAESPQAVSGRLHAKIQTEPYLEELHVSKQEAELATQTDPFLDRPSTPLFVPKLSGKCVATQIEDGDLFDFEQEVEPILQVLIGKTVEQSLMEVLEEEELKAYAKYKAQCEQVRNVELAKCQQLEEEERRRVQETQRRTEQAEQARTEQQALQKRIEAQRIAVEFLQNIEEAVFCELDKKGYFYDPMVKEIEDVFLPTLLRDIQRNVQQAHLANLVMDDIVQAFIVEMVEESVAAIRARDAQQREIEREQRLQRELNERFVLKRREFTKAIKSQKDDYDLKQQVVAFLDIPLSVTKPEPPPQPAGNDEDGDENKEEKAEDEEEAEIPPEIQANIEFVEALMEQFGNEEEPLWKPIASMLQRIGGDLELEHKIRRMDAYLERFRIKACKKELLATLQIYKEDEEKLKKAVIDCLEIDTFDEEQHNKYIEILTGDSQQQQMELMDEWLKETQDVQLFVSKFVAHKEEERRIAAEEEAKAKAAEEAANGDDDEEAGTEEQDD